MGVLGLEGAVGRPLEGIPSFISDTMAIGCSSVGSERGHQVLGFSHLLIITYLSWSRTHFPLFFFSLVFSFLNYVIDEIVYVDGFLYSHWRRYCYWSLLNVLPKWRTQVNDDWSVARYPSTTQSQCFSCRTQCRFGFFFQIQVPLMALKANEMGICQIERVQMGERRTKDDGTLPKAVTLIKADDLLDWHYRRLPTFFAVRIKRIQHPS